MSAGLVARVDGLSYDAVQQVGTQQDSDVLRIDLRDSPLQQTHVYVANGAWSYQNPALCVMALLGAKPSSLGAAEGAHLPIGIDPTGEPTASAKAVEMGREALREAEWFFSATEDQPDGQS